MQILLSTSVSFILSAIFVAFILKISRKNSWYDQENPRKIHVGNIPRLGGIGFAGAYIIIAFILMFTDGISQFGLRLIPILLAMSVILGFGVLDDFKPMKPKAKLLVQSLAAILVISNGYFFKHLHFAPLGFSLSFGILAYPLAFLWLVGITNALNLIDGLDGLAGGVSTIIAISYASIFFARGNSMAASLSITLAGAVCGFLVFNAPFPKARIFMGDCGSQFLGFMLALLPLLDDGKGKASLPFPFAVALLLVPILDTVAAVWRRLRDGRRIDSPDMAHMHHKLLNIGFSTVGVDLIVFSLQILIGILAFSALQRTDWTSLMYLAWAYIIPVAFFTTIHYGNRMVNRRKGLSSSGEQDAQIQ